MLSEARPSLSSDYGMPTQAGNNQIYKIVYKAKSERELLSMLDKLALKMGGKYKDANDELIRRAAVDAFNTKGNKGRQDTSDRNILVQVGSAADLSGGGTIKLDDKSSVKISQAQAKKIHKNLNLLRIIRLKIIS